MRDAIKGLKRLEVQIFKPFNLRKKTYIMKSNINKRSTGLIAHLNNFMESQYKISVQCCIKHVDFIQKICFNLDNLIFIINPFLTG